MQIFDPSISGSTNISGSTVIVGNLTVSGSISSTTEFVGTASYAITASYALNGGGGGGGTGTNVTSSFSNLATWNFNHGLNSRTVIIQTYDNSYNQIIPEEINLVDDDNATITFPTSESGFAIASLGGVGVTAATASYVLQAISSSFASTASFVQNAQTASYVLNAVSSSFASTASYINTLNQNVIITGSLAIGTGSIDTGENNLLLGPAPAGGAGEGGQIALLAAGGSYTSSSFIDNWQNQLRILRGPGATSNAGLVYVNLQSGNTQFVGAITASSYSGLPNTWLHALRSGNQTIGSGTWADRDIIFNQVASSDNFPYNSSTGIASLPAGKTYRVTARVAWSAAGLYTLKFRIYNHTTGFFTGPTVEMIQSPNGTYNVSDNTLEMMITTGASSVDISIRTTSDTNALTGEYIRGDLNTQLIIQQIA